MLVPRGPGGHDREQVASEDLHAQVIDSLARAPPHRWPSASRSARRLPAAAPRTRARSGDGGLLGGEGGGGGGSGHGGGGSLTGGSGGGSRSNGGGMAVCPTSPAPATPSCGGATTSISSGTIMDPAGQDGLYNIAVYVPEKALSPLDKGVPMGADASQLRRALQERRLRQQSTTTGVDGSFKLENVPVGSKVPLVAQVGKWRKYLEVDVTQCKDNPQGNDQAPTGPSPRATRTTTCPDMRAVSTGYADTLECLMTRIGLPKTGSTSPARGGSGHIHVFSGRGRHEGAVGLVAGGRREPRDERGAAQPHEPLGQRGSPLPVRHPALVVRGRRDLRRGPGHARDLPRQRRPRLRVALPLRGGSRAPSRASSRTRRPPTGGRTWRRGRTTRTATASSRRASSTRPSTARTSPSPRASRSYQWLGLNMALGVGGAMTHDLPIASPRYNAIVGAGDKPSQPSRSPRPRPTTTPSTSRSTPL